MTKQKKDIINVYDEDEIMIKQKETCSDCGREIKSYKTLVHGDHWVCAKCAKSYDAW